MYHQINDYPNIHPLWSDWPNLIEVQPVDASKLLVEWRSAEWQTQHIIINKPFPLWSMVWQHHAVKVLLGNRYWNSRFEYLADPPIRNPWIDLTERLKSDSAVVGTHSGVPLFEEEGHYLGQPGSTWIKPRQPHNVQRIKELQVDLIHPRVLATFIPSGSTQHQLKVIRLRFFNKRYGGGIDEVFKVSCPLTHNVPSSLTNAVLYRHHYMNMRFLIRNKLRTILITVIYPPIKQLLILQGRCRMQLLGTGLWIHW